MKRIFKYKLEIEWKQNILVGDDCLFLKANFQENILYLWYKVDNDKMPITKTIRIIATGECIPDSDILIYLDTVFHPTNKLVFHIFEEIRKE